MTKTLLWFTTLINATAKLKYFRNRADGDVPFLGTVDWMVVWNGEIANSANIRSRGHNIVKCLVDNLGFKLMPITSSMAMTALSGQLATVTV